jgi:hypothetical protein
MVQVCGFGENDFNKVFSYKRAISQETLGQKMYALSIINILAYIPVIGTIALAVLFGMSKNGVNNPLGTEDKFRIARIGLSLFGPLVNLPLDIIGQVQRSCQPKLCKAVSL